MEVNGVSEVVEKIINETLASGVEPLRRTFSGVYDGYDDAPVAYVSETEVFLSATGVIKGYQSAIDQREVGVRWSLSNIAAADRALTAIHEAAKKAAFVTAPVTRSFLEGDVEGALTKLATDGVTGENILLAFPEKTIIPLNLLKSDTDPYQGILHLDCTFMPVGRDKAIIYRHGFMNPRDADHLIDIFGKENVFEITTEEMYFMNSNVFSISEDVVVTEEHFTRLNKHLREKWGMTVETVPYREISKMGGLLRCSTLPLRRD